MRRPLAGGLAIVHRADVASASGVDSLLAAARKTFGDRIDILVNVAGGLVARKALAEAGRRSLPLNRLLPT